MAQFNRLSKREWEVVELLLQGKSNKLIASALGISARTVEFHLKNIYAKVQVRSRVELILKLGNATGTVEFAKLGSSTVDDRGKTAENRDTLNASSGWAASCRTTVSMIGKELDMKQILSTKHAPVGVITALLTGLLWIALLRRFEHMSLESIQPWVLPLLVIWAITGLSVGLVGRRNGNTLPKVFFSTLFGTGVSPVAILPLMGFVVLPLGKLAEWLGLIDPSKISRDVATMVAIIAMLAIWLVLGVAIGNLLLFVTLKKPAQANLQKQASEHGL